MRDPERWLNGSSSVPDKVLQALRSAPGGPQPEQLQLLAAQLGAQLDNPLAGAGKLAASAARSSWGLKLVTWVGVGAFLGAGGSALVAASVSTSREQPAPAVAVAAPQAPKTLLEPLAVPSSEPVAGGIGTTATSALSRASFAPAPRAVSFPSAQAEVSELELLKQAQQLLGRDPRGALGLAERHAASFPDGSLSQEREVIVIEALLAEGRADAARARASAFTQRYPGSAHARRIAALFENLPSER